jgi:hypothetical protein
MLNRYLKMKDEYTFQEWFEQLKVIVLEKTGVEFRDVDAVKEDYDSDKHFADVADEIALEYAA